MTGTGLARTLVLQGDWAFRRRSWLPVPVVALALLGAWQDGHALPAGLRAFGALLVAMGLAVRAHATAFARPGTSGGNRSRQAADSLNTDGLYSMVRHPLYLGNALMWSGLGCWSGSAWVGLLVPLSCCLLYERIMLAEESFLLARFGPSYEVWAEDTPALVPDPSQWRPPSRAASLRAVVRREHSSVLSALALLVLVAAFRSSGMGAPWPPSSRTLLVPGVAFLVTTGAAALEKATRRRRHSLPSVEVAEQRLP